MRDDGLRPVATGDPGETLKLANDDDEHIILELCDQHPWVRLLVEEREKAAFFAGFRAAMTNHTDEFVTRAALLAYARFVAEQ